jgi:hypothetical protein
MHKNAMKCNKTLSKWYKSKHGASKIIDTFETYQWSMAHKYAINPPEIRFRLTFKKLQLMPPLNQKMVRQSTICGVVLLSGGADVRPRPIP